MYDTLRNVLKNITQKYDTVFVKYTNPYYMMYIKYLKKIILNSRLICYIYIIETFFTIYNHHFQLHIHVSNQHHVQ